MQQTTNDTTLWFESELTARYQADLSGAYARAYLRELREREAIPQTSLDQQIDSLLEQWRYSLLDVALAKQGTLPPFDLFKALVVIEAYDQAIALAENALETISTSQADILFDMGIFCLDLDPNHPKAALFFEHAFQAFSQPRQDNSSDIAQKALVFAKRLLDWKWMTEAKLYFEIAFQIWKRDLGNKLPSIEARLIWTLTELGDWDQAEEMLAAQPKNPCFLAGFGAALLSAGQTERAESYLKQICVLVEQDEQDLLRQIFVFLVDYHYWQWAIALVSYSHQQSYTYWISRIHTESLQAHAWQVAEQICDIQPEPANRENLQMCLVAYLLKQGHYLEAERVAKRFFEGRHNQDSAFKEVIAAYATAQCWFGLRESSESLPSFEEHLAFLSSYFEMWMQEGILAEASQLLEKINRIDDRLVVEIQLAVAYHERDLNTHIQVALADLEARLIQLEPELESPQSVWYELAAAYAKLELSEDLGRVITKLRANPSYLGMYVRLRAAWFLEQLLDQGAWQVAEEYACSVDNLVLRSDLLGRLCLLAAQRRDRAEVLRLAQLTMGSRWQETRYEKFSALLNHLVEAYIEAGLLNEANQVIPFLPKDHYRQYKIGDIIPAFIQKQNWNEALMLLEAYQNEYQAPQFYKQLYFSMRRAGQHKRAEELYRTDRFQHNLQKRDESWQGYKYYKQASTLVGRPIARQQWRKAERFILQTHPKYYQPRLYDELASALLPKKRWNELIRITHFVENDPTMQYWYRLEAYQRLIRALGKAGRWRQALRVISMLETDEMQCYMELPLQKNLIVALVEVLVERSWFKQALVVYSTISDPEYKLVAAFSIMVALGKAQKWQQVEALLHELDGDLVFEHGWSVERLLNQLLLLCHRHQRYASLESLCEWANRFFVSASGYSIYLTTLCQIGRLDYAKALAASIPECDLEPFVKGLLKIRDFDGAEQMALKQADETAYAAIAETYTRQKLWDRSVRFAQRAIRQADNYDKIQACQPLIMSLIALRPNKAQRMVDLLKQQIALEQRLEDRMFATEGILIAN